MGNTTNLPSYPPTSLKKHFKSLERHQDPILVFDSNQEILFSNRLSQKLFKTKKNKLANSSLYAISPDFQIHQQKETRQAIVQEINGFGNDGPKDFQWCFKNSHNKEFTCTLHLNLFRSDGKLLCTVFLQNVQQQKKNKTSNNKNKTVPKNINQKTIETNKSLIDLLSPTKKPKPIITKTETATTATTSTSTSTSTLTSTSTSTTTPTKLSTHNRIKKVTSSQSLRKTTVNKSNNNTFQKKRIARNSPKDDKHHILTFGTVTYPFFFLLLFIIIILKIITIKHQYKISTFVTISNQKKLKRPSCYDYDTKMTDKLEKIKTIIWDSDDFSLENEVIQDLNDVYEVFKSAITYRDSRVAQLNKTLNEDRKKNKKKYQELESHLQRRLIGLKGEQELKQSLQSENNFFQKNFNEMNKLVRIQKNALKKMRKIAKKTKDFKNNVYQSSSTSEDSRDDSLSSALDPDSDSDNKSSKKKKIKKNEKKDKLKKKNKKKSKSENVDSTDNENINMSIENEDINKSIESKDDDEKEGGVDDNDSEDGEEDDDDEVGNDKRKKKSPTKRTMKSKKGKNSSSNLKTKQNEKTAKKKVSKTNKKN
ncbi:bromo adjacent homology domain-containing 1 protein [Anaeramoeba flamelloides]|uniref:Bromo adjacent homology domain-containing 1 protein n=1 Tax=Anaeramoeba flamelloides TaxID=1746091 RepID=A0ABQ8Z0P4_9EUKA|nr:bromo adjacent homology domain-containing 1 protein [Anaeramoeba flamelloides]